MQVKEVPSSPSSVVGKVLTGGSCFLLFPLKASSGAKAAVWCFRFLPVVEQNELKVSINVFKCL